MSSRILDGDSIGSFRCDSAGLVRPKRSETPQTVGTGDFERVCSTIGGRRPPTTLSLHVMMATDGYGNSVWLLTNQDRRIAESENDYEKFMEAD